MTIFHDIPAHVNEKIDPPKQTGSFEFSGEQEIYDDGVFRIELASELVPEPNDSDESMKFSINGLPFRVEWTTIVLDRTQIEQMGGQADTIEGVMRFFMPDLTDGDPLRLIPLANGFNMASHGCVRDGECRACCLLAQFVDEDTLVGTSVELTAPAEWENDPRMVGFQHFLKSSVRSAQCSLGEPRINSSRAWLNVGKIGVRFPVELGGMKFRFASDYESTREGEGVSLRYSDDDRRKADIYIFDLQEELIEPGAETDQTLAQMQATISDLEAFHAPTIPELLSESVSLYGREEIAFLDRRFFVEGVEPENCGIVTVILLAARLGAFIKVRFSPLPGETQPKHPLLEAFMNDLADVVTA